MSATRFRVALLLGVMAGTLPAMAQQRPSSTEKRPPDPPSNHVEVRFAMGKQSVTCKRFQLTAKAAGQTILAGSFVSGFSIPPAGVDQQRHARRGDQMRGASLAFFGCWAACPSAGMVVGWHRPSPVPRNAPEG